MAISESAFYSSGGLNSFLTQHVGGENAPFSTKPLLVAYPGPGNSFHGLPLPPIEWLKVGSYHEDSKGRFMNHFYTLDVSQVPKEVRGLTDFSELDAPGYAKDLVVDSLTWATSLNGQSPLTLDPNIETWKHARAYQYASLTEGAKTDREDNLAHMLYALGHVLHLNQDLSQPEHTRNDEHPKRRAIEKFGETTYLSLPKLSAFPLHPRGWSSWRDAGFTKLKDFWDRDFYSGSEEQLRTALNNDATGGPGQKLGLGEFSNGNFLGQDAIYAEDVDSSSLHYFPFPRRSGTEVVIDQVTYRNSSTYSKAYLRKVGDGIPVTHHSTMNYVSTMRFYSTPMMIERTETQTKSGIDDPNVLQDYHSILIPKAIEYSAGILDYFFRGSITVENVEWNDQLQPPQYTITIRNQSGQQFASGGKFFVLKDDSSGNRSYVTSQDGVSLTQDLTDGNTWQFNFPGPQVTAATKYILVYQGTIGASSGSTSDAVDKDIAIAVKSFSLGCEIIPPEASTWVASLTESVPSVSAVYSYQVCGLGADFCEGGIKYATRTYYDLVPSQPNLSLTPTAPYSGPTFWLLIDWGGMSIYTWVEIGNGFNSVITYEIQPLGQASGYAINPICNDASCLTSPPDPPVGDYPLVLTISPCSPF